MGSLLIGPVVERSAVDRSPVSRPLSVHTSQRSRTSGASRPRPSRTPPAPRPAPPATAAPAYRRAPNVVPNLDRKSLKTLTRTPETAEVGLDASGSGQGV